MILLKERLREIDQLRAIPLRDGLRLLGANHQSHGRKVTGLKRYPETS
jgi:hypothetical protein